MVSLNTRTHCFKCSERVPLDTMMWCQMWKERINGSF
jgi:hypothetical protein